MIKILSFEEITGFIKFESYKLIHHYSKFNFKFKIFINFQLKNNCFYVFWQFVR